MTKKLEQAEKIIKQYGCDQSNLIAIMQDIQAEYKYLSEEVLTLIAERLGISTAKVYSVATFYENLWRPRESTSSASVLGPPAMCASQAPSMMPSTTIWVCPSRKRPLLTVCSPWKQWPV